MKRRWALVVPAVLIVGAVSCSKSNKNNATNNQSVPVASSPVSAATAAISGSPVARAAVGSPSAAAAAVAGWPTANRDYANTRAEVNSQITSQNVKQLGVAWAAKVPGISAFGALASNPIVVNSVVYLQDLKSNVYAYDLQSGQLKWQKQFDADNEGPNGPAYDNGKIFVSDGEFNVAALDANSGQQLWTKQLAPPPVPGTPAAGATPVAGAPGGPAPLGIDIQMTAYNGTLYTSTVPGTVQQFYPGAGAGTIYALDEQNGNQKWSFDTVNTPDIWGNPTVNSGGGAWYPPAIDTSTGMTYWGIGNPAPWPGTPQHPNGSSRPGPNLYSSSELALNATSGKLQWYNQVKPHDLFDLDFQISPILAMANVTASANIPGTPGPASTPPPGATPVPNGTPRKIVIGAGKLGYVVAFDAATGQTLWKTAVGAHQNDDLQSIPQGQTVQVSPGALGGVETPMAYADGVVYVPGLDFAFGYTSTGIAPGQKADITKGKGWLTAIDVSNGKILWTHDMSSPDLGAAMVSGDLVFTSDYSGRVSALDRKTGNEVWSYQSPDGINGWMAISGDTVLVPAGVGATPSLIALRLGAHGTIATPTPGPAASPSAGTAAPGSAGAPGTPAASASTPRASGSPSASGVSLSIDTPNSGDGISFNTDTLHAPAGAHVTLTYTNNSTIPHNWHLFNGPDANSPSIAMTAVKAGPNDVETVQFTAPSQPGSYFFDCDVHPTQMIGHLIVP